eukprot:CAMPEP_0202894326 /NCGR_PEP_ID=MMETSP1392-20130828/3750_1 /ASSEMBLY_ACC=CAM_ASM_000868 /TAXON_ID=225041 /ORGANISM="Chlamydomonas chlamydogama, Strain SAG 11-48b" /LENGTH=149 /DNA_ID=CAMNT_0049578985 /DNA_START=1293 /DNA_END=1743 /DNA_ORIENTATION=-
MGLSWLFRGFKECRTLDDGCAGAAGVGDGIWMDANPGGGFPAASKERVPGASLSFCRSRAIRCAAASWPFRVPVLTACFKLATIAGASAYTSTTPFVESGTLTALRTPCTVADTWAVEKALQGEEGHCRRWTGTAAGFDEAYLELQDRY